MRDRVAHEWRKKPNVLHYRVCHKADELFLAEYKGKRVRFEDEELVHVLAPGAQGEMKYEDAKRFIGFGDGVLIVNVVGDKFFAETEAGKGAPSEYYAGS